MEAAVEKRGGHAEEGCRLFTDVPLLWIGAVWSVPGEHVAARTRVVGRPQVSPARHGTVARLHRLAGQRLSPVRLRLPCPAPAVCIAVLDLPDGLEHLGDVGAPIDGGAEDADRLKVKELAFEEVMHDHVYGGWRLLTKLSVY